MSRHSRWEDVKARRQYKSTQINPPVPIQVNDFLGAPVAEHNQLCHVCWTEKALYDMQLGVFKPCWSCMSEGWRLIKLSRAQRFFRKHGGWDTIYFILACLISVGLLSVLFLSGIGVI